MSEPIELNQRLLDLIDCGVVIHGPTGEILGGNRRALELLGLSHEELLGSVSVDPRWNVIDDAGAPMPGELHPASITLRTGEEVREVLMGVYRPTDGTRAWLLVTSRPKFSADAAELRAVIVTFTDVTARRQAEQDLKAEHRLHAEVMSTVQAGITLLNPDGGIIYANPRAEQILGLGLSEIEGRRYDDPAWQIQGLDGEELDPATLPYSQVLRKREPVNDVQHAIRWPDGRRRVLNINGAPIFDEVGGLKSLVFAVHDHTLLHQKERALFEATSRLGLAVAAAELAVVEGTLGPAAPGLQIDPSWARAHGKLDRPGPVPGWDAPIAPADATRVADAFRELTQGTAGRVDLEFSFTDRSGQTRHARLLARGFPIENEPEAVRVAGILRDVTAEHELRDAAENERRRQAELTRLSSLSVMAGGVAHEFNNLLVGILAGASAALDELPADASSRPMLELITETGQRAAALTRQLLAYSGEGRFSVEKLRIDELVDGLARGLRETLGRHTELYTPTSGHPLLVEGDASQLRQALFNVVLNATEALPEGRGQVWVRLASEALTADQPPRGLVGHQPPEPGDYVVIEVEDNGAGVSAAQLASIFEPFTTTKAGRQGLGLPAVLGVVRGHRGWVSIERLPEGTRVRLGLPAVSAPVPVAATTGPTRVLLVDDEEMVRRVCARVLRRAGMTVVEAEHGAEALSLFHGSPGDFDVVLLDLVMPVMDGEQTFVALRKLKPDLPVLLMSGYSRAEVVSRAVGQGLCGFLSKPFTSRDLTEAVREVLDDAALATAARGPR